MQAKNHLSLEQKQTLLNIKIIASCGGVAIEVLKKYVENQATVD